MRGDTGFIHKPEALPERIAHGNCWYNAVDKTWWHAPNGEGCEPEICVSFDPDDGTRLSADGTVTERCDAVTPEAVKATEFWGLLSGLYGEQSIYCNRDGSFHGMLAGLQGAGLVKLDSVNGFTLKATPTEQGRTIFAALAGQSAGDGTVTPEAVRDIVNSHWMELLQRTAAETLVGIVTAEDDPDPESEMLFGLAALGLINKFRDAEDESIYHFRSNVEGDSLRIALAGQSADTRRLIEQARHVMQDFVDKCDRGEARSVRTYAACKQWLAGCAGAALADASLLSQATPAQEGGGDDEC